jgi:1,4-alpha-glucan branching enzyme
MRKRVMLLTWEYPPRNLSPISRYCRDLSVKVSKEMDVIVVTFDDWKASKSSFKMDHEGLYIFYVENTIKNTPSPLMWSLTLSSEMERVASDAFHELDGKIDVIHANDWITFPTAIALKKAFNLPLITTLHSIEPTRVAGSDPYIEAIKKIEWQATYEADRVLVNNLWMKDKLKEYYQVPEDKIDVCVPDWNGWSSDVLGAYKKVFAKRYKK